MIDNLITLVSFFHFRRYPTSSLDLKKHEMASEFFWNDEFSKTLSLALREKIPEISGEIWQNYVQSRLSNFCLISVWRVEAVSYLSLLFYHVPDQNLKFKLNFVAYGYTHLRTLQYFINAIDACRSFPSTQFCFKQLLFPVQNAFLTFHSLTLYP